MQWHGIRGVCTVLLLALLAGCNRVGDTRPPSQPAPVASVEEASADSGEFTVAENMLDTWNTIGQILVGLDGVTYEGRAQMLGLYSVRYRGEPLLIRTQAVVIGDASQGIHTRVDALGSSGEPIHSAAATALLRLLGQRVPSEVVRYRQRIKLHPDKPATKHSKKPKPGKR